jgi:homopolymeric O-antigen transport system ATP-binding protein
VLPQDQRVPEHGGSIVLVSHNAYSIRSNCDRVVWIEHGVVQDIGATAEVCDAYEAAVASQDAINTIDEYSDGTIVLSALRHTPTIDSGAPFTVELELEVARQLDRPIVAVSFSTLAGQPVVANNSATDGGDVGLVPGRNVLRITYDELPLVRGIYGINVVVSEGTVNNQLFASLKRSEFEVRVPRGDLGAGAVLLHPVWTVGTDADRAAVG